ncbi:unnamed protein product [Notodromas monacha]|uniref:Uncharacterized protein n=1 Tax=Notodromas monacha TaxID=399045 RepID=A0A7R9BTU4_9CRUS|nr:unnamed protein product [Notodromas monacha]CAG0920242.1 unnamed protein product [Notodromas monacha]
MFLKTVSVCAVFFAAASAAPEEFKKAENLRNEDGSANVEAIMNEIKRGQLAERDRGLAHLKRANREADADKKADFMSKFNDATFAYKFLTHMSSRANDSTVCSNNEVAKHYRCTFSDCFAKSLGVPDF